MDVTCIPAPRFDVLRSALRRRAVGVIGVVVMAGAWLVASAPVSAVQLSETVSTPMTEVGATPSKPVVDNAGRTVVDVSDFGADPTGQRDSATGIRAAIAHAKTIDGPTTIHFPDGKYHIWPEQAAKRELYVSNTSGTNQAVKTKNIGILIEDMGDVIVDGGGSTIVNHGFQTIFAAIRSTDVRFTNFSQDWVAPKTVDITVADAGVVNEHAYRVIDVPETYRYSVDGTSVRWFGELSPATGEPYWTGTDAFNYSQVHDPASNRTWRTTNPVFRDVADIVDLGDGRLRILYQHADRPTDMGYVYQMRETTRDTPGGFFWESTNVTVDHLQLGYLHGFGLVGQFSENITIDSVRFTTDRSTGRVTSAFADHIQMSGVKGTVRITNNVFDNPQDDPINVHGTYLQVATADQQRLELRYMHHETAGFPQFYPGDTVEIVDKRTMLAVPGATATVVSVDGPTGRSVPDGADPETHLRSMVVVVDQPLPDVVVANPAGYVAENITYTPQLEIVGNTFQAVPTRGILVTTRRPVLIEDNYFDGMSMSSIYISSDAYQWFESGPVRDVTIRGNVFDRPASPVIWFDPTNREVVPGEPVHRNVLVEDNVFNLTGASVVSGSSVGDLVFRGNAVNRYARLVLDGGPQEPMRIGDTTTVSATPPPPRHTSPLFTFDGAADVTIAENTYDRGFNQRIDTHDMPTAEITVIGDDITFNADNQTSDPVSVTYTSSRESVATVDDDGVVTAIGSGETVVTAHATIGGEQVTSNPVAVKVTGHANGDCEPVATAALSAEKVEPGGHVTVTAALANDCPAALRDTTAVVSVPPGWSTHPSGPIRLGQVPPGEQTEITWAVEVPPDAPARQENLNVSFDWAAPSRGDTGRTEADADSLTVTPPPPTSSAWLSDLPFMTTANAWGPVERDLSNGERAAGDGSVIMIAGRTYDKGLGVHAYSEIEVYLGGRCSAFTADVGVDDEVGGNGSVSFDVSADGERLWSSGTVTGTQGPVPVDVDVAGADVLRLRVTDGGDGNGYDHADWADAHLKC